MTIEKGQSWGEPAIDVSGLVRAADDAGLAELAASALEGGERLVAELASGDLLRTLGLHGVRPPAERYAYPMDLAFATIRSASDTESDRMPFVAHATVLASVDPFTRIAESMLGHGPPIVLAIMNGAWLGPQRLGPKAHPNDGRLDVVAGRVGFRERREAHRRSLSGAHLPHPALSVSRVDRYAAEFERPQPVRIDGVSRGDAMAIRVELVPDALMVVA